MTRSTSILSPVSRHRGALVALTLVAGLGLTACGDGASDTAEEPGSDSTTTSAEDPTETPTETPTEDPTETATEDPEPSGPVCSDVWVDGATLPEKYSGCRDAESDKYRQAIVYMCSSGQRLVTFGRTFYAAKGGVITESETPLARNPEFTKVLATCGA